MPVIFEDEVVGILEMASLEPFTNLQQNFLQRVLETLGITINSVQGRMEIERLLKESQAQTEELQAQSEELQSQSEELQAQSEELQSQAEELRMINEQLSERELTRCRRKISRAGRSKNKPRKNMLKSYEKVQNINQNSWLICRMN